MSSLEQTGMITWQFMPITSNLVFFYRIYLSIEQVLKPIVERVGLEGQFEKKDSETVQLLGTPYDFSKITILSTFQYHFLL